MKLSELIAHVGDEHITVQRVDHYVRAEFKKKTGDTEITFATKETSVGELMYPRRARMRGLIIWLPREKLPESLT